MGDRYFQRRCSYQVRKRCNLHLPHDVAAVDLERDLADAKLGSRLLVEKAAHDQRQHLTLARRQALETPTELGEVGSLPPHVTILRNSGVNPAQQIVLLERLGQEVDRPSLDRAYRRRYIAMSGDKHDWRVIPLRDLALQVQAVDVRKIDIENQACR